MVVEIDRQSFALGASAGAWVAYAGRFSGLASKGGFPNPLSLGKIYQNGRGPTRGRNDGLNRESRPNATGLKWTNRSGGSWRRRRSFRSCRRI